MPISWILAGIRYISRLRSKLYNRLSQSLEYKRNAAYAPLMLDN